MTSDTNPVHALRYHIQPAPSDSSTMLRQWLAACRGNNDDEHEECRSYRGNRQHELQKPTRLLFLDPKSPSYVRLVEVKESGGYAYVTLSHRWGPPPHEPLRLSKRGRTLENTVLKQNLEKGILSSSLPRLFREAVEIVRSCCVEYLWIDSLCIVQDKDAEGDIKEWADEAGKMGDIYAGGVL